MAGSIFSFWLINLPVFSDGSPFPDMISLILAVLSPSISASFACVSPISNILSLMVSANVGAAIG